MYLSAFKIHTSKESKRRALLLYLRVWKPGVEICLCSKEHLLFLLRTWVWIPATTWQLTTVCSSLPASAGTRHAYGAHTFMQKIHKHKIKINPNKSLKAIMIVVYYACVFFKEVKCVITELSFQRRMYAYTYVCLYTCIHTHTYTFSFLEKHGSKQFA